MIKLTRIRAVTVVLASSAVALAGCGSSSSGTTTDGPASAGSGATPASGQAANSAQAAKYSQCMRAHGVPDFPDPGSNGRISLKVTKGSDLDPNSAAYKSAQQSCKSLQPPGLGGGGTQSVANQKQELQFVSCMRSHGVPNMPDPQPSGAMIIGGGQGINPNSPQFKSAIQTCHKLLPGGGTGGTTLGG